MEYYKTLTEDETLRDWLRTIDRENTVRNYYAGMCQYLKFTGMSPLELLEEAEDETQDNRIKPRNYQHVKRVLDFLEYLQAEGRARTTLKNRLIAVKSFYSMSDITFPKRVAVHGAEASEENSEHATKEDIAATLLLCDPLERAVMLAGLSSGLSKAEIMRLKIEDFKPDEDGITTLCLKRIKTRVPFVTFLTPEATEAVKTYLEYRKRKFKDECPFLFIERYLPARPFKDRAFTWMFNDIAEKAGKA
jgi:integrase